MWPFRIHKIVAPKWSVPNGKHMNDDVVEVHSFTPQCYQALFSFSGKTAWE